MPPLKLETFNQNPSWQNRAGRIDRSACIELKASDIWPYIQHDDWKNFRDLPCKHARLIATATVCIYPWTLLPLIKQKRPRILQGDFRTTRSNAFKHSPYNKLPKKLGRRSIRPTQAIHPFDSLKGYCISNPNQGAMRTKLIGIPSNWSQQLTLQRWRLHAKLAQHFFTCPTCNKRALKLFLPQCTKEEYRDAGFARLWIDSNQYRITRSSTLRPQASRLISRYGLLFPPRQLQCRKCLALRYGEHKPPKEIPHISPQFTYPPNPKRLDHFQRIQLEHSKTFDLGPRFLDGEIPGITPKKRKKR